MERVDRRRSNLLWHPSAVLAAVGCLVCTAGLSESGNQRATAPDVLALQRWVAAVNAHLPGLSDAGVNELDSWTPALRGRLASSLEVFERALLDKGLPTASPSTAELRIAELARDVALTVNADVFLQRAAVLHADAAIIRSLAGDASRPAAVPGVPSEKPAIRQPQTLVTAIDGVPAGESRRDWNWEFARGLLDLLARTPEHDEFVGAWYHATAAFFLRRGLLVQAEEHLEQARRRVPDDARVLFDDACRSEVLGLPLSQQVLSDEARLARRLATLTNQLTPPNEPRLGRFGNVPLAEVANRAAEQGYVRALRMSPSLIEARIRLGRLLGVRGRHREAVQQLRQALLQLQGARPAGVTSDSSLAFYAHLLMTRAASNLGDAAEVDRSAEAAHALYPQAQSAMLSLSLAAWQRSDAAGARHALEGLGTAAPDGTNGADPWWDYHLCSGRNLDTLIRETWARVPR